MTPLATDHADPTAPAPAAPPERAKLPPFRLGPPDPTPHPLSADIGAGIVVALVALPLCLGIALASGAPLLSGLVSGVIGGIVVGWVSGSSLMVSGPAAGLTAIVLAALATLGSFESFLVAVFLAGLMQIALAFAGAGVISYYFPGSVIKGMLSAIGLILILKQIPHAVGYDVDAEGDHAFRQADGENTFTALARAAEHVEPTAALIAAIALTLLFLWPRLRLPALRAVPAPLLVVLIGVGLNELAGRLAPGLALAPAHLVNLPAGEGPLGLLAGLSVPAWETITSPLVWRVAVTIAIVASLETLLSLDATDKLDPFKRSSPGDRELLAQGVGNSLAGLAGGLPVTGVIVRSAANVTAGGRTKRSTIIHGTVLLVSVMLIPGALNRIPLAALAAILIHTGFKLASPALFRSAWRFGWEYFLPFTTTIVAILFTDLLVGILVGLAVGAFFIVRHHGRVPMLRQVSPPGAVLTRYLLPEQATFLGKASLEQGLAAIPARSRVEIDARHTQRFDHDILELLHDFKQAAASKNIDYRLVGVPDLPSGRAAGH